MARRTTNVNESTYRSSMQETDNRDPLYSSRFSNQQIWRSRSQPPFGDSANSTGPTLGTTFLNTESNQQMASVGFTNTNSSAIAASQAIPVGSSPRASSSSGSRCSTSRRSTRTCRSVQNRDTNLGTLSSSSSSNSSLLGRYRTISGTSYRPHTPQIASSESHLSRLLRCASLRLDRTPLDDVADNSVVRQDSPCGTDSTGEIDEFAQLPTHGSRNPSVLRPFGRPASLINGPCSSNTVTDSLLSAEQVCTPTVSENFNRTVIRSVSMNSQSTPHLFSSLGVNPEENDSRSSNCTVRFPQRNRLLQQGSVTTPSGIDASSSHEPEADHDFHTNSSPAGTAYRGNDHTRRTLKGLDELRRNGIFCDVELHVGPLRIQAHRNVLAASSQYFYAMFAGPMTEARSPCVQIQGVDHSALKQLIDFIYTNEIVINEETVQNLLPAANLLQLTDVRDACCEFLQSQLHPSNCLGIQRFADLHDCPDLLDYSRRFTEQHFAELLKQDDEFLNLSSKQLSELISSDRLAVSEDLVFEAVLRWVAHDPENRQPEARELCGRVRFGLLPRDYLVRLSQSDNFLAATPWCKDYLIEALSYHLLPWEQQRRVTSERTKPRTPFGLPNLLLVIGGQAPKAIRSVECYDFRTGLWSPNRTDDTSSSFDIDPNRSIVNPSSPSNSLLAELRAVTNNCISSPIVADLPSRRCRSGVGVLDGLVYVVGGFNGALRVRTVEIYNPARNSWHSGPNMEFRRSTLGVAVLNGLLYAVGGFDGSTGLNSAEVFDVLSGTWRSIAPMNCQRSSVGVGAVNGKLYAVGGYDGTVRRCLSSVECYDPVLDVWTAVADMKCRRSGPAVCELNNRLYVVGGHDGPVVQNTAEVFSPEVGVWQRIADLNIRRRNAGLIAHEGFLYVVGGEDGQTDLATVEKYDPTTNVWILLPNQMNVGRSYAAVTIIQHHSL